VRKSRRRFAFLGDIELAVLSKQLKTNPAVAEMLAAGILLFLRVFAAVTI